MPKPPRPSASEVLRHNLLILVGLPSHNPRTMSQNWLQCIFGVFSFHAGAYFTKYYLELNNFSTALK